MSIYTYIWSSVFTHRGVQHYGYLRALFYFLHIFPKFILTPTIIVIFNITRATHMMSPAERRVHEQDDTLRSFSHEVSVKSTETLSTIATSRTCHTLVISE